MRAQAHLRVSVVTAVGGSCCRQVLAYNGHDGLLIDSTSTGNHVLFNVLVDNNLSKVGAFDLEDDTFGLPGTTSANGGTANFYFANLFGTTNTSLKSLGF